ncbi:4870_t:CDS:2, partial [Scutellospora calospora]
LTDNPFTRAMGDHIMKDQSAKRHSVKLDLVKIINFRVLSKDNGLPINNVYAIGDCATAQVANQKAKHLRK